MTAGLPTGDERLVRLLDGQREAIASLCLELGNLPDQCGEELAVAEALSASYAAAGLSPRLQYLSNSSANVIASWAGRPASPARRTLILNSHLDTEGGTPAEATQSGPRLRGTWRQEDLLIGKGLVNAKAHLVAQLYAVRALAESGFEPAGEVILTGTAQETGYCPASGTGADEWTSPHGHEGIGARSLIENGVLGDFALVGEPTGFAICTVQAGYLRLRVRVPGLMPYTPFLARDPGTGFAGNPVEAAAGVVQSIVSWAVRYEATSSTDVPGGRIAPRAQVQEVRSSFPAFTNEADCCDIFVDVRTLPGSAPMAILRDLSDWLRIAGHHVDISCCGYRRGYLADGAGPLVDAVRSGHRQVFGADPAPPSSAQTSMWQDTNAFNEAGIPSVSYGIRPRAEPYTREKYRALHLNELVALIQVYIQVILAIFESDQGPPDGFR